MKIAIQFITFFIVTLVCFLHFSFCEGSEIDGFNQELIYINMFQCAFSKKIEKEFDLKLIDDGFQQSPVIIGFYAYRRATLEEARALELSIWNKLAEEVRADPKMLSSLNALSLTLESIIVNIHFVYSSNWSYRDGSIESVYCYNSRNKQRCLEYRSTDPFCCYLSDADETFSTRFEESFEDAVKLNATLPIINPTIHVPTRFEEELAQVLTSFEKEMKKKHSLRFQASGWMVAGKATPDISEIRTLCIYLHSVDCQEARALVLLATKKLLAALNNSETLRPYLNECPFSASRLKLRMLFREEKLFVGDVPFYDGSMESAVLSGNTITYYHYIPNIEDSRRHDIVVYAKESYQEAQKTFEKMKPPTFLKKISKAMENFISDFIGFMGYIFIMVLFGSIIVLRTYGWLLIIPVIIIIIFLRRFRVSKQKG